MALLIRRSKIHADGCYTTAPIKKYSRIIEYTGQRLTPEEADALYDNSPRTYLFGLSDGKYVIDGDGVAAFINHSCTPNCEPEEIKGKVYIKAIQNIKAEEELTYDYNLYDGDPNDPALCFCGTRNCRGSMYSEEELAKRKKTSRSTGLLRHPSRGVTSPQQLVRRGKTLASKGV
jgi:SET domain-containing protein